ITTTTLPDGTFGVPYDAALRGASSVQGTVTWRVVSGFLPPGVTIVPGDGTTARLSGTPSLRGPFPFTIELTDSAGSAQLQTSIAIGSDGRFEILSSLLAPARESEPYRAALATRGATGAVTWSVDGLPPGLAVQGDGASGATITGTP